MALSSRKLFKQEKKNVVQQDRTLGTTRYEEVKVIS